MAKQEITEYQKKLAQSNVTICEQSLVQNAEQIAAKKLLEAKKQLDKLSQQLAQLPEELIGKLNKAIYKLLYIINGHVSNLSKKFNPEKIINELENLIKPVVKALQSLPVLKIPGLKQILKLLELLKTLLESLNNNDGESVTIDIKVGIPPALMEALTDLLSALQSLCTTLPLIFVNLIFKMFQCVIGLLKKIAGAVGLSLIIPYPLNLVPQCIDMIPDILDFILYMPDRLNNVMQGILKKMYGKISALQFPQMPDTVSMPRFLPSCPKRDAKEQAENALQSESTQNSADIQSNIDEWTSALQNAGIDTNAITSEDSPEVDIDYSFGSIP